MDMRAIRSLKTKLVLTLVIVWNIAKDLFWNKFKKTNNKKIKDKIIVIFKKNNRKIRK